MLLERQIIRLKCIFHNVRVFCSVFWVSSYCWYSYFSLECHELISAVHSKMYFYTRQWCNQHPQESTDLGLLQLIAQRTRRFLQIRRQFISRTAKAEIGAAAIWSVETSCRASVSVTCFFYAAVRATFLYFVSTTLCSFWILFRQFMRGDSVPILDPLPYVANGVVQAVFVRIKTINRSSGKISVIQSVGLWELTLPDVNPMLSSWHQLVAPGKQFVFKAAPRGFLPFSFSGQSLFGPLTVRHGVVPWHVGYRVVQSRKFSRVFF